AVGLQHAGVEGDGGGRSGLFQDRLERVVQLGAQIRGRVGVQYLAPAVYRRVVKIVDLARVALLVDVGPGGGRGVGIGDAPVRDAEQGALGAEPDGIGIHVQVGVAVQPRVRIGEIAAARDGDVAGGRDVGAQVLAVVLHGDIAEGVGVTVRVGCALAAVHVADPDVGRGRIAVGELDGEILLARLGDGRAAAGALVLVARVLERLAVRRAAAVAADAVELGEEGVALGVEVEHVDGGAVIDGEYAHADAIHAHEGAGHAGAQGHVTLAVVAEPVGEVLHLLGIGADGGGGAVGAGGGAGVARHRGPDLHLLQAAAVRPQRIRGRAAEITGPAMKMAVMHRVRAVAAPRDRLSAGI